MMTNMYLCHSYWNTRSNHSDRRTVFKFGTSPHLLVSLPRGSGFCKENWGVICGSAIITEWDLFLDGSSFSMSSFLLASLMCRWSGQNNTHTVHLVKHDKNNLFGCLRANICYCDLHYTVYGNLIISQGTHKPKVQLQNSSWNSRNWQQV